MSNIDRYHPDIRSLVEEAIRLEDPQVRSLFDVLQAELARRDAIRTGLDVGECLQFDTLTDMVRERTKLGEADVLVMIRAHEPGRVRGKS